MAKRSSSRPPKPPTASRPRVPQKVWQRIYLKEWREFRHFTTEGLAAEAGVSPGLISQIENGLSSGSADSLEKLAKALKIEVGELLDVKPQKGGSILRVFVSDKDRETARRLLEALSKDET